jgi:hypothetical protein
MYYYGPGLVVLILDIYCIVRLLSSPGDPGMKVLWILLILFLPLLGAILYLLLGSKIRA